MKKRREKKPKHHLWRQHRPSAEELVGWTEKEEEEMAHAIKESECFMEKFCAGIGVPKLPIVNGRHYAGVCTIECNPLYENYVNKLKK